MTASVRVMSPEEITAKAGGEAPFLIFPTRSTLFALRAMRLRQLSAGHAMADFLNFAAELASAQQLLLDDQEALALPGAQAVEEAARDGRPPLPASAASSASPTSAASPARDPVWLVGLDRILVELIRGPAAAAAPVLHESLSRVAAMPAAQRETQASLLLDAAPRGIDLAAAPLIGAALQAHWTRRLLALNDRDSGQRLQPVGRIADPLVCPACGSPPVASVIRTEGGPRYLQCSLCALQWQYPRIRCAACAAGEGIAYQSLALAEGGADDEARAAQSAVRAETCEACGHYLKIFHRDRDPQVEPVADDLASLTLDLLVSEAGSQRHGTNLLLLFGETTSPPA